MPDQDKSKRDQGHWTPGKPHISEAPQPEPVVPQAPGRPPLWLPPPASAEPVDVSGLTILPPDQVR